MGGPPANDLTILQLQIITELTVRLAPVLPLKVALTSFPTVAQAVSTVVSILSAGMAPTSLELLDGTSIRGLNLAKLLPESLPEEPTVLMRFSNPDDQANFANLEIVRGFVHENGGRDLKVAKDEKENDDLWTARKVRSCTRLCFFPERVTHSLFLLVSAQSQYWSQQLLVGEGCRTLVRELSGAPDRAIPPLPSLLTPSLTRTRQITDVCVPISRLAEFVSRSDVLVEQSGLVAPIVAHIGDGNVHRAILWKGVPGETEPPNAVEKLAKQLVELAQELEGTCAGEHGIGCAPFFAPAPPPLLLRPNRALINLDMSFAG